jgi:hypothetical protein
VERCVGRACDGNQGDVAKDSRNGFRACDGNTGNVAQNACNGERACFGNSRNIRRGQCNGELVNGVGVCEGNMADVPYSPAH